MSRQAKPVPIAITAAGFDAARAFIFSQRASLILKASFLRSSVNAANVFEEQRTARSCVSFARDRSTSIS
jgi:hypothetical protein